MVSRNKKMQPLPARKVSNRLPGTLASTQPSSSSSSVDKTLTKGLHLLETLAEYEQSRGISELAHELSLNKSNVHRLLQTLIRCGYVTREESTERYLLSSKLWRLSRLGRPFDALRRLARPTLRSLVQATGESAVFVVVENDELVLIDQVETQSPVRVFFSVGQSFPIGQVAMKGNGLTALQLVALSHRPDMETRLAVRNVQRQLRKGDGFADRQLSKISEIRKNGFAVSRGEWVSGINAVAVPVTDASQHLIGVLSCFGPAHRIPEGALTKMHKTLHAKARELSRRLSE